MQCCPHSFWYWRLTNYTHSGATKVPRRCQKLWKSSGGCNLLPCYRGASGQPCFSAIIAWMGRGTWALGANMAHHYSVWGRRPREGHYCNVSIAAAVLLRGPNGGTPRVQRPLPASRLKLGQLKASVFCLEQVMGWLDEISTILGLERTKICNLAALRRLTSLRWRYYHRLHGHQESMSPRHTALISSSHPFCRRHRASHPQ